MTDRPIDYKAIYDTAEFTPEFIAAQAKRLAELYLRRRQLDDELSDVACRIAHRINPLIYLLPLLGAVIGGLIGGIL